MPGWIGVPELVIILVIVLLIFGAGKLPFIARDLGMGIRQFRDAVRGIEEAKEDLEDG